MPTIRDQGSFADTRVDFDPATAVTTIYCGRSWVDITEADIIHLPGVGVMLEAINDQLDLVRLLDIQIGVIEAQLEQEQFEVEQINAALAAVETNIVGDASVDTTEWNRAQRLYRLAQNTLERMCLVAIELVRSHKRTEEVDETCQDWQHHAEAVTAYSEAVEAEVTERDEQIQQLASDGLRFAEENADLRNRVDWYELFLAWLADTNRLSTRSMPSRVLDLDNAWAQFCGETGGADARRADNSDD